MERIFGHGNVNEYGTDHVFTSILAGNGVRDPFVCYADREYLGDDDEYMGDDYVGDDDDDMGDDDDLLGAIKRIVQKARRSTAKRAAGGVRRAALPRPAASGRSVEPHRVLSYMGVGAEVLAATNQTATFVVEPQREFTITRLIIDEIKSGAGVGGVLLVDSITVGDLPQSPAADVPAPASQFRPDATYSEVRFQTIGKGCKLVVKLSPSVAIAGADTISTAAGSYGWMVR